MPTINLSSSGKVLLKDGKVSCQCCGCAGLWGPGHDTFPNSVTISPLGRAVSRISKCDWINGGHDFVQFYQLATPPIWRGGSNSVQGYKVGVFSDGPLGDYRANADGSGAVIYTVT